MSLVTHIFRKDVRHLRWLLAGWFLVVILQTGLVATGAAAWNNDAAMQMALRMLGWLVPFLKWILLIVMVPLLIQDEPLTGHTAFWFTRPIGRLDLLKSKGLFLGLLIIVPPALAEFVTLAANGIGPADLAVALPEILWDAVLALLPVVALAAVTGTFARFAVAGAAIYASLIVVALLWQMYRMFTDMEGMMAVMGDPSLLLSKQLVGGLLGIVLLGLAIVRQYLTRRTAVTVGILGLYGVLTVAVNQMWRWDFMAPAAPPEVAAAAGLEQRTVTLGSTHSSDVSMSRQGKEREKELRATLLCDGLPPAHFAQMKTIESKVVFSDGVEARHSQKNPEMYISSSPDEEALEQVLSPAILVAAGWRRHSNYSRVLKIKADLYDRYRFDEAELSADVVMSLFRYEVAARLPLKVGAGAQVGTTAMTISDVLKNPGGCTVVFGERRFALKFKKQGGGDQNAEILEQLNPKAFYVLVNPRLGEAYLAESDMNFNFDPFARGSRLKVSSPRHSFLLKENDEDVFKSPEAVEGWLADAELWWINIAEAGTFDAKLHEKPFQLDERTGSEMRSSINSNALAAIQLPESPTKEQVRSYVGQIARVSARQNRRSSGDPQVAMLKKVGAAHVDVLVESMRAQREMEFYLGLAIGELAGPEHKELILDSVRRNPDLIQVVSKKEWMQDLDPALAEQLRKSERYARHFRKK